MIATDSKEKNTNSKDLSMGFIGVGWIGRNRMEVMLQNPNLQAAAIAEPFNENAEAARKVAPDTNITKSPEEIYENEEIDAVVIATPSAMHAEQSIKALNSGKAVFCQKPLGRTAAEVREVINASARNNKLLGVDMSYRYTKAFKAVYEVVKRGNLGKIYAVDLVFHNAYGPDKDWFFDIKRSGGGSVMDLGIHLIDLALWSLDFPGIREVNSKLYHKGKKLKSFEEEVEDFAQVSMISEDDTSINLQCSWHVSAGRDAVIEAKFYGTEGGAAFKNVDGSFYDFVAEKYSGTQTEVLVSPPDDWSGRAGLVWVKNLLKDDTYDEQSAEEFLKTSEIIDRIYGR
ncbi:Gfo/Idh/MocA family oxidoreductase [Christiangramia sp.]|uniref:Gfo/Idh/MocA family protein n=1 Tax=Christiangramia sp. TaxID=1931228 RepID=UPI002614A5EA|nr:Gfo/Idh/MocA family oxidoreductase [Christiangramia sp.]